MNKINNNITEDYCSFEVSQLILQKGGDFRANIDKLLGIKNNKITHALAIKWIRENFQFHICIYATEAKWNYNVFNNERTCVASTGMFSTTEEATEAALLYILKNLIE